MIMNKSHPSWVCGLKPLIELIYKGNGGSYPSWVCGLKRLDNKLKDTVFESHPSWVCGLKLQILVAGLNLTGHTLRGCVD